VRMGSLIVREIGVLAGRSSDLEGGASATVMGWGWSFSLPPAGVAETLDTGVSTPSVDGPICIPSLRFSAFHLDLTLCVWTHADFSCLAGDSTCESFSWDRNTKRTSRFG